MTGLTQAILEQLAAPFKVNEHEFRDGGRNEKLVYITEEPLIARLTEVDVNWTFEITSTIITDYGLTRPDSATVTGALTLCGVTRANMGSCVANIKKGEYDKQKQKWIEYETPIISPLSETEIKGAATDALKRCARQFGVGGYLLRLKDVSIKNEGDFARWYASTFGKPAPRQNPRPDEPASTYPMHISGSANGKMLFNKTVDIPVDYVPEPRQNAKTTPKPRDSAPVKVSTPSAQESATTDDFPTIHTLWGGVASSLLATPVANLPIPVGGIIYPVATKALGYDNDDHLKAVLELGSLTEFAGSLEALMARVIELSPVVKG